MFVVVFPDTPPPGYMSEEGDTSDTSAMGESTSLLVRYLVYEYSSIKRATVFRV